MSFNQEGVIRLWWIMKKELLDVEFCHWCLELFQFQAQRLVSAESQIPVYPFSAVVGQDEMKLCFLLNVIDPKIGSVVIIGDRGTGKSKTVRSLGDLLPEIQSCCWWFIQFGFKSSRTDGYWSPRENLLRSGAVYYVNQNQHGWSAIRCYRR